MIIISLFLPTPSFTVNPRVPLNNLAVTTVMKYKFTLFGNLFTSF